MPLTDPGLQDGGEDLALARVLHLCEGEEIEVPQQAMGDRVPTATRGAHGAGKVDVHQVTELP